MRAPPPPCSRASRNPGPQALRSEPWAPAFAGARGVGNESHSCRHRRLALLPGGSKRLRNRLDNTVIRPAPAQIPAHPLAQLVMVQRDRFCAQVAGDMARHAARQFVDHTDRRAQLPRRAITALETVMPDERLL